MLKTSYEQCIAAIRALGELLERQQRGESVKPEEISAAVEAMDHAHTVFRGEVTDRVRATMNRGVVPNSRYRG